MEKEFVEGLFVNRRDNAPEFIKASLSFQVDRFIDYLNSKANAKGYVNIDIKLSKGRKLYAELDNWRPQTEKEAGKDVDEEQQEEIDVEKIPF